MSNPDPTPTPIVNNSPYRPFIGDTEAPEPPSYDAPPTISPEHTMSFADAPRRKNAYITSSSARAAVFVAFHLLQLVSAAFFLGGMLNTVQYGANRVCLLYIRDYHASDETGYEFSARSIACPNAIAIATTGLILSIPIAFISLRYRLPGTPTPKRLILSLAMLSTSFALIALTMASFATAGLKYTCDGFEAVHGPGSCRETFEMGLVDGSEPGAVHERSLEDLDKVVAWGWVMGISWAGYAGCEWGSWKVESVRWW